MQTCFTSMVIPSATGMLLQQNKKDMGHAKSAVLLLGRLLMASLFVFVGYTQVNSFNHLN